ncbi:nucleotidyltransferase domain-containing protein [Haloglomus salinum]|uniref:nucleotidyltransferase domain-containing protein n=1 Tax=Haloglomus salinum TaxID=2962673 RepID=UPI0020C9D82C|nr:nucleotidyltransferase domain-containing protein [Haloglomus salinum]
MTSDDPPGLADALAAVERDHDARVVAARDIGSRAWNLHSPLSDHDVAALFVQRPAAYARLGDVVDSVERTEGETELRAWNVRRFGELLADSNPTALEFCHSPLVYRAYEPLSALVADVAEEFGPMSVYHHYRSLATRQYHKYLQQRLLDGGEPVFVVVADLDGAYRVRPVDDPDGPTERVPTDRYEVATTDRTVKRALYVVRGILYAEYVRDTHRFPPLDFGAFLDSIGEVEGFDPDPELVATARDLAERKRAGDGDALVGDPVGPGALPPEHIDPETHAVRGIPRERVNAFIERALADAPE